MPTIYDPQEDSYLLANQVKKYSKGIVLDIGTGTGIQVLSALENKNVKKVIGVDISKKAIEYCNKNIKKFRFFEKAEFFVSNMFSYFKKKNFRRIFFLFDTIIFNPPYLPSQMKVKDLTIEGGKKGYEIIERFLSEVNEFLKPNGIILIVFSSLTKKEKVDNIISNNLLEFKILDKKHIFFEDLFVYLIKKSEILKKLESLKIKNIKYYAKGKRGIIFQGFLKGKKVAIKLENPKSKAINKIEVEVKWLKKLNKYSICPKLIFGTSKFLVIEFIEGKFILDYIKNNSGKNIKLVIKKIFEQLYKLDKLHIAKEEMHRPIKHIIVRNHKPILIDFERVHYTKKPKNVTQFCEFLMRIEWVLREKRIIINRDKIIQLAKHYKTTRSKIDFKGIVNTLK